MPEHKIPDQRALSELAELGQRPLNFDLAERAKFTTETGWNVDDYLQPLPAEAPGEPVPGGSWVTARKLMADYEFADPAIVRAVYSHEGPLEGRDMLLEIRFIGLRFRFGVRVADVVDEVATIEGRPARIWGWSYRTLQGHVEMGQMDYEVRKWLDDGEVEFRIHVVSRAARIGNPVVALGFRLFGRREQTRFARHACQRMAKLVAERVDRSGSQSPRTNSVPSATAGDGRG